MMKNIIKQWAKVFSLFLITIFLSNITNAQTAPDKYWVQFTDKNNSPYSVAASSQYLSPRAIQRRINQNIAIQENDLPVNPAYVNTLTNLGAVVLTKSKWFNGVTIFTTNPTVLDTISHLPFVSGISKTASYRKTNEKLINKFEESVDVDLQQSGLGKSIDYGNAYSQIHMLNGEALHNAGYKGQEMIISIIDAGFDGADTITAFDSLWQNNRIFGWHDFVNSQNNLFTATLAHGMNVLSILAGNLPGQTLGSAPDASYWLLRSEDAATEYLIEEDNWIAAAEFADSVGTDVINTSLGYSTFTDPSQDHTYADMNGHTTKIAKGVNMAVSKGMLVVVSAGNSGDAAWHYITTPGDADSALTIGAVDNLGIYAGFSSVGPASDGAMKPNVTAMGKGTTYVGTDGNVHAGNGTSFSAPLITGLATCLWQANPQFSNMQILAAIEQSASQYLSPDYEKGYGIPDFGLANQILNIKKTNIEKFVRAFPNPFSSTLAVEFYSPDSQQVKIEIFNFLGVCVYLKTFNFQSNSYNRFLLNDLESLSKGAYILKASTRSNVFQQKIIKGE